MKQEILAARDVGPNSKQMTQPSMLEHSPYDRKRERRMEITDAVTRC